MDIQYVENAIYHYQDHSDIYEMEGIMVIPYKLHTYLILYPDKTYRYFQYDLAKKQYMDMIRSHLERNKFSSPPVIEENEWESDSDSHISEDVPDAIENKDDSKVRFIEPVENVMENTEDSEVRIIEHTCDF